jgi:hypothetical protein
MPAMRTALVSSVLALLLAAPAVAVAAPGWCKAAEEKVEETGNFEDVFTTDDPRDAVWTLVATLCWPNGDQKAAAGKLEATRQAWSKKLGMSDADWADAAVWASRGQGDRNSPSLQKAAEGVPWSAWGPVDQYAGILNSRTGYSNMAIDPQYVADALGAKLTEAGRLGYLTTCLRDDAPPVEQIMCNADVVAFDVKKLSAELRGDTKRDGYERMVVRIAAALLAPRLAKQPANVKALVAKDPAYGEMLKLADGAKKTMAGADPALVALAAEIDDARVSGSRKAAAGCQEKTWAAWEKVVAASPAKAYAALIGEPGNSYLSQLAAKLIGEPNGYLASLAFYTCHAFGDDEDILIRSLGAGMARWPGLRGPRTATHTAIVAANLQLDQRDARIDYPEIDRPWLDQNLSSNGGGTGEIAKLTPKGDTVVIDLAKVKSKGQECVKGHRTNRIIMIRTDGVLVYDYVCEKYKTVTYNEPPAPPQTINARYAKHLKKGMAFSNVEDVIVIAYPKNGAETPSVVAGVAVK